MKKRNLLSLILVFTLLFSVLCGCKAEDTEKTETEGTEMTDTENTVDNSDDASSDGLSYAEFYSSGLTEDGFFEGVTASEIVTLPEYKGVSMPASVLKADESSVKSGIESVLDESQLTTRAVEDGDTVNIDYVGSIDGVEFSGGSTGGQGTSVTIGVTNYIDDFLYQLIGHMPGETFNVEVTFPDDYGVDELNGKDAVFVTTINYIRPTELTADIAAACGFNSVDELMADIENSVIADQKLSFLDEIIAGATCDEIPESVLAFIKKIQQLTFQNYASYYGMTLEDFISAYSGCASFEEYFEEYRDSFELASVQYLAIQAIAEKEGLKVTTDDIMEAGMESFVEYYGKEYIKMSLMASKVVPEFVADNAVVEIED